MDSLTYHYTAGTNKLNHVRDAIGDANYTVDIDNQASGNYEYDAIGNLVKDVKEGISNIEWTVYGKIKSISKTNGTAISYEYDAAGNRVQKTVVATGAGTKNTFYVRDAQGNVMSLYADSSNTGLKLNEQHVYGSSRLGLYNWGKAVAANAPVPQWQGGSTYTPVYDSILPGSLSFELSNHLGNVLSTISDKKIGIPLNDTVVNSYIAEVLSQNDYYPFGMMMPGRTYTAGTGYRYGFNGKENDNEVKGEGNQQDYGMRIYDPRLGKFLSVDPIAKSYPFYSPYHFAGNNPIENIDLEGAEPQSFIREYKPESVFILSTKKEVGSELSIYDTELNPISVQAIHDKTSGQLFFVHRDVAGQWFYLKNDDGNDQVMHLKPHRGGPNQVITQGKFVPYKTYDEIHGELLQNLAGNTATAFFGLAASGAALAALPGTVSALTSFLTARASDPSSWASAASDYSAQRLSGKSNSEVNLTSVAFNWLIPGGGSVKSEIIAAATTALVSSGFEYSAKDGLGNSLLGDKSVNSFLIESLNDASGNYFGGKFGGKFATKLQGAASDKVANFGLGVLGNYVPDLIVNGASNSATENQKKLLELNK